MTQATKTVIVTGGGRGIGAATCRLLASRGFRVIINYRQDHMAAESLNNEIRSQGGTAIAICANVTEEQAVVSLFNEAEKHFGPITHLVNNAGRLMAQSPLAEISLERMHHILKSNFTSCFLCCREAAKRMPDGGAIVNVSSLAALTGSPFEYIDYAASKGAMDTLTRGLSQELANRHIRVNGVRPGFIDTEMHADGGEADRIQRLAPNIPLQRGGTPQEVANAVAWLLSDEASYTTGSFVDIAGGK